MLESAVMEEMWLRGEATARQVLEALNQGRPKPRAYTTVMTTMRRLHRKGLLNRERHGKADLYAPRISRVEYRNARVRVEVEALVDEFGAVALAHFSAQVARLDPERVRRLRELAEE